ncbi:MAG: dihydrofolate reductase [Treponema sp.]|nr:dihydrofolate reductase [Treponema sp.]
MQDIIIIAAMAENGVIGRNNALPWSLKEDLARFRELTLGWPCIMGRKTWESLPKRPLPGRLNIVVSQSLSANTAPETIAPALVFPSLQGAIKHCYRHEKVFICGGASIYHEALEFATTIELTQIHRHYEGDVFFPRIDPALWIKTNTADFDGFSFISYSKVRKEKI